ncbi:MAG: hypothetical protein HUU28_12555 [Planctomycetaceae bacterium]|nr:hypothetical protein [Planctomycetaceae bacterium]
MIRTFRACALLLAASPVALAQDFLIMPDSTNNRLVSLSPVDGSVINSNLFGLQGGTPIVAVQVGSEIWVTEQIGDRVSRWTPSGTLIGNIGGQFAGGGLDNVRGAALVNGTFYVCCSGTANGAPGDAIVKYDMAGNPLGFFPTVSLAASPFSVLSFQGDLLVSGSSNNNDIYRFTLLGTPVSVFHNSTTISFAHQLNMAGCCDVFAGGFTTNNVVRFDAVGNSVGTFAASGARGVYQLQNGNVLWTNGSGAWVYDTTSLTSTQVYTGGGRHVTLFSTAPSGPVSYCTAGLTTNGCVATISADNNPSVSLANTCNITVTNVEGQKSGLIFYSITGQNAAPWNATSFLCVKSPTQRTGTQTSGGTVNLCDGTLVLDWNNYQSLSPSALGQPWSSGNLVQVQAWFRDPPAGKATNLSDGIEMTYVP